MHPHLLWHATRVEWTSLGSAILTKASGPYIACVCLSRQRQVAVSETSWIYLVLEVEYATCFIMKTVSVSNSAHQSDMRVCDSSSARCQNKRNAQPGKRGVAGRRRRRRRRSADHLFLSSTRRRSFFFSRFWGLPACRNTCSLIGYLSASGWRLAGKAIWPSRENR